MAQATGNSPQPSRRSERKGNSVRISIAIKFALFITVLMIVFMVAITLAALSQAEQAQQREVNDKGIELVGALTAALEPQWFVEDNRQAMEKLLGKIQKETEPLGFINALVYDAEGNLLATGKRESQIRVSKNFEVIESYEAAKANVKR